MVNLFGFLLVVHFRLAPHHIDLCVDSTLQLVYHRLPVIVDLLLLVDSRLYDRQTVLDCGSRKWLGNWLRHQHGCLLVRAELRDLLLLLAELVCELFILTLQRGVVALQSRKVVRERRNGLSLRGNQRFQLVYLGEHFLVVPDLRGSVVDLRADFD